MRASVCGGDALPLPRGSGSKEWILLGCELVPNCWHRHPAGRESRIKMGRWPSRVSMLTDGIKEKLGQAGQVSGKQTPRGRDKHFPITDRGGKGVQLGCFRSEFNMSKPVCRKNNVHLLISGTFRPRGSWVQGIKAVKSKQAKCPKVEYTFFSVSFVAYLRWHFDKCIWTFSGAWVLCCLNSDDPLSSRHPSAPFVRQ